MLRPQMPTVTIILCTRYKAPKVIRNAFEGGKAQRDAEEAAASAAMHVDEEFSAQQAGAGDATDASSSRPQTEILTIDNGSGGGSMTARSNGSGGSERSSRPGGGGSVRELMNSSIFIAKELGFALEDDGFASKSLIDARMHRLNGAIAAEMARNSKSQAVMRCGNGCSPPIINLSRVLHV